MAKVDVLGMHVDDIGKDELILAIGDCINKKEKKVFAYVNAHAVNIGYRNEDFRSFINNAAVAYCDGAGVRLGARIMGSGIRERIALTRWVWELAGWCSEREVTIFLLGGAGEIAQRAAKNLQNIYPRLKICGTHHGYFDKDGSENEQVVRMINEVLPQMLFVGFGMPLQERWIEANFEQLKVQAIVPCGAMLDYVAGAKTPAPVWMSRIGLEWLHRLIHEPGRLWQRYLVGNPLFLTRVMIRLMISGRHS